MMLALMQPYFFPYIGYFALIAHSDLFIFFDQAQYIRRGWVNRNRIAGLVKGWDYITVPVNKCSQQTTIAEVTISKHFPWRDRIMGQLQRYEKDAPFYEAVRALVLDCLASEETRLSELNISCIHKVCQYLGLEPKTRKLSEMEFDSASLHGAEDWVLGVCRHFGADGYLNLPGGVELYSPEAFQRAGIQLRFIENAGVSDRTRNVSANENLSIIDVLMWNSPQKVRNLVFRVGVSEATNTVQSNNDAQ